MYRYLKFVQIPNSVFLCPASGRIPDMASRIFGYKKGQIYVNLLTSLVMYLLCRVVDTSPFHQRFIVISITDGQTFPPISRMAVATLRTRQRSARTPSPILDKTAVQMSIDCCHGHGDTAHRTAHVPPQTGTGGCFQPEQELAKESCWSSGAWPPLGPTGRRRMMIPTDCHPAENPQTCRFQLYRYHPAESPG